MTVKPRGIVFDADDVPALAEFWHQATEYEVKISGEWFAHLVPTEIGLRHIFVFKTPEERLGRTDATSISRPTIVSQKSGAWCLPGRSRWRTTCGRDLNGQ